jgi:hypothetical protein
MYRGFGVDGSVAGIYFDFDSDFDCHYHYAYHPFYCCRHHLQLRRYSDFDLSLCHFVLVTTLSSQEKTIEVFPVHFVKMNDGAVSDLQVFPQRLQQPYCDAHSAVPSAQRQRDWTVI